MINEVKNLFGRILRSSAQLSLLTERPFTPDGHMIGSLGEVYVRECYGVQLYRPSNQGHDATWQKRQVQIKATQRKSITLKESYELLIVLKINPDGGFEEIYNGDGKRPWQSLAHRRKTPSGIRISLAQLKKLNRNVSKKDRIPRLK